MGGDTNLTGLCFFVQNYTTTTIEAVYITDLVTVVLNALFSTIAVTENTLVIYVIVKHPSLRRSPSNILLCSLAISDLVIGVLCQTSYVGYKIGELKEMKDLYCIARLIGSCCGWICAGVSLLTISAIIVDRYLALLLHMRYNAIVTVKRVHKLVSFYWVFCTAIVLLRFIPNVEKHWVLLPLVLLILTICITLRTYWRIFKVVRQHHTQIIDFQQAAVYAEKWRAGPLLSNSTPQSNHCIARYKRTAATMVYVLCLFLICYLPFLFTMCADAATGFNLSVKIAYDYAVTIVFISSSLNPVVYCFRLREIRLAVVNTIKIIIGLKQPSSNAVQPNRQIRRQQVSCVHVIPVKPIDH